MKPITVIGQQYWEVNKPNSSNPVKFLPSVVDFQNVIWRGQKFQTCNHFQLFFVIYDTFLQILNFYNFLHNIWRIIYDYKNKIEPTLWKNKNQ